DLSGDRSGCAGTLNTHVGAALRGRPSLDVRCVGEPPRGGHRGPPLHGLSGDRTGCAGTLNTHVGATCRGGPPWRPSLDIRCVGEPSRGGHGGPPLHVSVKQPCVRQATMFPSSNHVSVKQPCVRQATMCPSSNGQEFSQRVAHLVLAQLGKRARLYLPNPLTRD